MGQKEGLDYGILSHPNPGWMYMELWAIQEGMGLQFCYDLLAIRMLLK